MSNLEEYQRRLIVVKERILFNLSRSAHHANLSAFERIALAEKLAGESMSFTQPGFNNGASTDAATAWGPDDPESKSDRFKAAMNYGDDN